MDTEAGDRFPWLQLEFEANGPTQDLFQTLDDTRFNLIVIGQPAPPECGLKFGDLLRTHVIPDLSTNRHELARVGIPALAFYLLRPDGHVGLAGTRMDAALVTRYLTESHLRLDRKSEGESGTTRPRNFRSNYPGQESLGN